MLRGPAIRVLLLECSDLVVRADEDGDIPCCKYTCLAACSVIREVAQATALETTPDGKAVVPFPGVPARPLRVALDVLHEVRAVGSLSLEEVDDAMRGMDVMGCASHADRLLARAWLLASRGALACVTDRAPIFLRSDAYRFLCVSHLVSSMPLWPDFAAWLDSEAVDLDPGLAKFMCAQLIKFFPPGILVMALLDALPSRCLTASLVLEMVGTAYTGVYYHPWDIRVVVHAVILLFAAKGWEPALCGMLRTMEDGLKNYEVAPTAASVIHGSVVTFDASPMASVVLVVEERLRRPRAIRVAPWVRAEVDPLTGQVGVWVVMNRLDRMARTARGMQLRVTAVAGPANSQVADVWYLWEYGTLHNPADEVSLSTADTVIGSHVALAGVVRSPSLSIVRVDLFYAPTSIMASPLTVPPP